MHLILTHEQADFDALAALLAARLLEGDSRAVLPRRMNRNVQAFLTLYGDELPLEFRAKGLGPVIGTRTWGGLVGVSMFIDMIDGGYLTAPDYRTYTLQGSWTVENRGVVPDIEVWLDPAEMARGHDAQLEKAIEVLLDAIKKDPRPWPQHPPFPESQPMN